MSKEPISFKGYHRPGLKSGAFKIKSNVVLDSASRGISTTTFEAPSLEIFVAGPRFIFTPKEIYSVFPPRDSFGEHDNVLPHIELEPSILPWQRETGSKDGNIPWLALILLQEEEWTDEDKVLVEKKPWEDYRDDVKLASEITDYPEEGKEFPPLKILQIEFDFLKSIFPSVEDLKWLSHVRIGHDIHGDEAERAVLVCNRIPKAGARAAVHLVSLEGRVTDKDKYVFANARKGDKIPFVSIHSWEFVCPDNEQFKVSDKAISRLGEKLREKASDKFPEGEARDVLYRGKPTFVEALGEFTDEQKKKLVNVCHIQTETFKGLMDALDRKWIHITEAGNADPDARKFFEIGSVPLAHGLRQGGKTVSWYRGPLIADRNVSESLENQLLGTLPVRSADHLLLYNKATKMLDISYAAAWEIGRMISVSEPTISQQIAQWKTSHAREVALVEQNLVFSHIPFTDAEFAHLESKQLEEKLQQYFTDLSHLKGLPFHYLVPHESLLPDESLRFFYIDPLWIECLLDGAFSIGRTTELDSTREKDDQGRLQFPHKNERPKITGVLLRSDLVSGWPSLIIEAYESDKIDAHYKLKMLRYDKVGSNVLLLLFEGEIKTFTLHLPPESLHFGFSRPIHKGDNYFKELKSLETGEELKVDDKNIIAEVDFRDKLKPEQSLRVVDINGLKGKINETSQLKNKVNHSGHLAIELIEGVPLLRVNFADLI